MSRAGGTPVKPKRYRAGKAPENYQDSSNDDDDELQEDQNNDEGDKRQRQLQFQRGEREVITGVQRVEISEKDAAADRRLRRLREARGTEQKEEGGRRRRRREEDEEDEEEKSVDKEKGVARREGEVEEEDEDSAILRRQRMRERALQQRAQEAELLNAEEEEAPVEEEEEEEEEEEDEESSEYETDSEEDTTTRKLLKPVFIPKAHRETVLEKERLAREAEEAERRRQQEREDRKKESHQLVAEQLKKEALGEVPDPDAVSGPPDVDDTDGLDEQAEYEAWKLRELTRMKRDREERVAREKEQEEIKRRRALPEEERLREDLERARKSREKEKSEHTFLQKYYHKGAFYMDREDDVLKRDYTVPTLDETVHKEMLPQVMQVKNFGRAGQTKWTHLANEDTSQKDAAWAQSSDLNKRLVGRMGGMKQSFDKPTKRRKV